MWLVSFVFILFRSCSIWFYLFFSFSLFVRSPTFFTISAFPSTQANLVSAFTTRIMAKLIVTWSTKCRTRGVEIIFRALHTNTEIAKWKQKTEKTFKQSEISNQFALQAATTRSHSSKLQSYLFVFWAVATIPCRCSKRSPEPDRWASHRIASNQIAQRKHQTIFTPSNFEQISNTKRA